MEEETKICPTQRSDWSGDQCVTPLRDFTTSMFRYRALTTTTTTTTTTMMTTMTTTTTTTTTMVMMTVVVVVAAVAVAVALVQMCT
jgi:hypothetical protein